MFHRVILALAEYVKSKPKIYNFLLENKSLYQSSFFLYNNALGRQSYHELRRLDLKVSKKKKELLEIQKEWTKGDFYENPVSTKYIFELARGFRGNPNADTFDLLTRTLFRKGYFKSALNVFDEGLKYSGMLTRKSARNYINTWLSHHRNDVPTVFNHFLNFASQHKDEKNLNALKETFMALELLGGDPDIIKAILSPRSALRDFRPIGNPGGKSYLYTPQERLYLNSFAQPLSEEEFTAGLIDNLAKTEDKVDCVNIIPVYFTGGPIKKLSALFRVGKTGLTHVKDRKTSQGGQPVDIHVPAHLIPATLIRLDGGINILFGIGAGLGNLIKALPTIETIAQSPAINSVTVVSSNETGIAIALVKELPYIDEVIKLSDADTQALGQFDLKIKMSCFGQQISEFENIAADAYIDYRRHFEFYCMCQHTPEHEYNHLLTSEIFGGVLNYNLTLNSKPDTNKPAQSQYRIGVAAGRSINRMTSLRQWPHLEKFVALAKDNGHTVKFFGLDDEYSETYGENCTGLEPQDLFREIEKLDYFVCSDGGLVHLANFLGVTTLGLYGPSNYIKNSPQNRATDFSMLSSAKCSPCMFSTDIDYCSTKECMYSFRGEDIFDSLEMIASGDIEYDRQVFFDHELNRTPKKTLLFSETTKKAAKEFKASLSIDNLDVETFFRFQLHETVYKAYTYGQLITTDVNSLRLIIHALCEIHDDFFEISQHLQDLNIKNFVPALTFCMIDLRRQGAIHKTQKLLDAIRVLKQLEIKKHPKLLLAIFKSLREFLEIRDETKSHFFEASDHDINLEGSLISRDSVPGQAGKNPHSAKGKGGKKILWVCHKDLTGPLVRGGELSTRNIIDQLSHAHQNLVVTRSREDLPPRLIEEDDLKYWSIDNLNFSHQVSRIVESFGPDVISGYGSSFAALLANQHFQHENSVLFIRHFKDIIGANTYLSHSPFGQTGLPEIPSYRLEAFKKASKIIFNAHYPRDIAVKLCLAKGLDIADKAKVCFVPVRDIENSPEINGNKIGLINPSRAGGEDLLRELARMMLDRKFLCIGIPKGAMPRNVEIVNWSDVGTQGYDILYRDFALTLCPSYDTKETASGHGRVAIESIKLGIPVIAEATDTMKEVIPDDWMVSLQPTVDEWAEKIEEMFSRIYADGKAAKDQKLNDDLIKLQKSLNYDKIINKLCEEVIS